jgi:hypothetical protein
MVLPPPLGGSLNLGGGRVVPGGQGGSMGGGETGVGVEGLQQQGGTALSSRGCHLKTAKLSHESHLVTINARVSAAAAGKVCT